MGESEERPHVSARVPHAPRGPRWHAETAQRGVSSGRSEIGATVRAATAPIFSGAQVCAGCRFASCSTAMSHLRKFKRYAFSVRGTVSHLKSNVATLRK